MRPSARAVVPFLLLAACDGTVEPVARADQAFDAEPSWSPDGATVAFVRTGPRGATPLAARTPALAGAARASRAPGGPAVATSEVPPPRTLMLVPAAGGTARVVARTVVTPAWLPDGRALLATDPLRLRLVRVGVDDGAVTPAGDTTVGVWNPAVSRDGAVAAVSDRTDGGRRGGPQRLWLATPDALRRPLATAGPDAGAGLAGGSEQALSPTWGPDGRVAFQWWRAADGPGYVVAVVDTAGRGPAVRVAAGSEPAWSPTGAWIAYRRDAGDGRGELRLVRADGSRDRRLVGGAADDAVTGRAAWSPDGRFVAVPRFTRADGGALWIVEVATGAARRLTAPRDPR